MGVEWVGTPQQRQKIQFRERLPHHGRGRFRRDRRELSRHHITLFGPKQPECSAPSWRITRFVNGVPVILMPR